MYFDEVSLELGPFLFFGSEAGKPLPDVGDYKIAKHTKANAEGVKKERPDVRVVKKSQFETYETIEAIFDVLFTTH